MILTIEQLEYLRTHTTDKVGSDLVSMSGTDLLETALSLDAQLQQEREARAELGRIALEFLDADQHWADTEYKVALGYRRLAARMPEAHLPTDDEQTQAAVRIGKARHALRAALSPEAPQ